MAPRYPWLSVQVSKISPLLDGSLLRLRDLCETRLNLYRSCEIRSDLEYEDPVFLGD
jgi:hypothetical protein